MQTGHVLVSERAEGAHEPAVDLGFAERAVRGGNHRVAELEDVLWELEVEERALELLVLGRRRQHVVRALRGLGHGDVDDDAEVQGGHRLAHPRGIRQRVHGVAALDDGGPKPGRIVGEHRVGDRRRREHATDHSLARARGATLGLTRTADESAG